MKVLNYFKLFCFTCHVVLGYQHYGVQTFNKRQSILSKDPDSFRTSLYYINDIGGLGHQFDGVGGLSGGGATSRLLVNYQEPYRKQILDYLFKPGFGASLHILKVEIGGDCQSTDGTEHSHMHYENEENYTRGYEWWMMKEAKARNPEIKLVGLPWCWPGWIGQGTTLPYQNRTLTAIYVTKWVKGAKEQHGLTIDYVGIWNERPYDVEYIKVLRSTLDSAGFSHVLIIANDNHNAFNVMPPDILNDPGLEMAVGVIGGHYPGTVTGTSAQKTKKPLWSSEDYSTFNDVIGAGCWARILNQNYVNGNITATIAWNLVASYYDDLPFKRCSLMTANEPWSGHYEVTTPIWVTAHTTQFTQPGWKYLPTVGLLNHGGSYVALTDGKGSLTIIVETMSHDQSLCIRPALAPYTVQDQNVTFVIGGGFKDKVKSMQLWHTQLGQSSTSDHVFIYKGEIPVDGQGQINLFLPTDVVVTLSTLTNASKGKYPQAPPSKSFPLPYSETFVGTPFDEAYNFADQAGAFESFFNATSKENHQWTLRQVVTERPVTSCDDANMGVTMIGNYSWSNVAVNVSVKVESASGVFLALRVDKGSCYTTIANGLFLWLLKSGTWILSSDINRDHVLKQCSINDQCWTSPFYGEDWNHMMLSIGTEGKITVYLNNVLVYKESIPRTFSIPKNGFVAIGTADFGFAQFDDFYIQST